VLGYCCVCSFVFNVDDKIQVTSVVLRWLEHVDIKSAGNPSFTVEWSSFRTPTAQIVSGCRPVRARGAYRIAHSHDGLTLAVAANQRSPHNNRVIFISLLTSTAQVSDLKGCGTKAPNPPPNLARSFWVTDMKWTCDDLFIVCMTKRGSLAIMTRLGEPVRLESQGCSVELGPDMYLPFHPLISYTSKKEQHEKIQQQHQPQSPTSSMMSEVDIMKQKFSVSTHPSLPLLLCSDGYLVTVIQLPEDSSCANLMKTFLAEARLKLNKISEQHNIHTALLPTIKFDQTDSLPKRRVQINYQFEQAGDTMGLSTGSSMSPSEFLGLNDLDEGKLMFGDGMDEFNRTGGSRGETPDFDTTKHLQAVQTSLQAAWGLGISYTGIWTTQLDKIMVITVDSMIKLCELLLKTAPDSKVSKIEQDDGLLQRIFKLFATSPDMYRILMLLRHALSVLGWDTVHQNSSSYTLRLVTGLCQTLLQTDTRQSYFKTLACCYHILLYSEKAINNAYSWLPKAMNIDSSASEFEFHLSDNVEGTVLCRQLTRRRASLREFDYEGSLSARSQRGSMSARSLRDSVREAREEIDQLKIVEESVVSLKHTPAKRLMLSWKSLYRQLLRYHSKLSHRLTKASDITDSMDNKIVVKQQKVILLLCATQVKLHDLGFDIVEDRTWKRNLNRVFLKGAMHYEAGHLSQAIETWRDIAEEISMAENPSLTSYPLLETQSLLAVLYTQLQQSNLMGALQLVDSLIDCYSELPGLGGSRSFKQQLKLCKSDASFMSVFTNMLGPQEAAPILPCVNRTSIKPVVESLSRFMALYFSNRSLYIYPPHAAAPLKPLYNKDIVH
uniref:Uncharacterized protein C5orf42-like n=1 Tax=Saccoglossus kowalevskii TaxID=10224 RepID=A0ABM0LY42_SACKO